MFYGFAYIISLDNHEIDRGQSNSSGRDRPHPTGYLSHSLINKISVFCFTAELFWSFEPENLNLSLIYVFIW